MSGKKRKIPSGDTTEEEDFSLTAPLRREFRKKIEKNYADAAARDAAARAAAAEAAADRSFKKRRFEDIGRARAANKRSIDDEYKGILDDTDELINVYKDVIEEEQELLPWPWWVHKYGNVDARSQADAQWKRNRLVDRVEGGNSLYGGLRHEAYDLAVQQFKRKKELRALEWDKEIGKMNVRLATEKKLPNDLIQNVLMPMLSNPYEGKTELPPRPPPAEYYGHFDPKSISHHRHFSGDGEITSNFDVQMALKDLRTYPRLSNSSALDNYDDYIDKLGHDAFTARIKEISDMTKKL